MKYNYFISYSHDKGDGNAEIGKSHLIKTWDDIKEIENTIMKENPDTNGVILLNYKRLSSNRKNTNVEESK